MPQTDRDVLLSIIVPCYKVEQYLPKCLDSLVAQTLDEIEIICINDGSPDRCIDILREYRDRYGDKIVIIDKPNEGVWQGRWDGIAKARGEYIGFIDSDDYAEPTFAETLYTTAKIHDADIAVCGFERTDLITGKALSRELCTERPPFGISEDEGRLVELNTAPWNKCFRASVLKHMRNLDNPPTVLDDMAFHLLAYLDMSGTVAFSPTSQVHYMVRSDSIINTVREDQIDSILAAFKQIRAYYEAARPEMLTMLDAAAFLHLGISLVFRLSCDEQYDIRAIIDRMTAYLNENFPTWSHSPYINAAYTRKTGGAFKKLLFAQRVYKAGLMPMALAAYRFMIERLHIDIKW